MNPDTAQILAMLPNYPIQAGSHLSAVERYRSKQFPGTWSPQEFKEQTTSLVDAGCSGRDLMAWLVHAVEWPSVNDASLDTWVSFWQTAGPYLRAWTEGIQENIPAETLNVYCKQLEWHPLWRAVNMTRILDDFEFADAVRKKPSLTQGNRKAFSSVGALELAASSSDLDFRYACAERLEKSGLGNGFSLEASKVPHFLETPAFSGFDTTFQRQLLMASLCSGRTELLTPAFREEVHVVWNNGLGKDEQLWWTNKARIMTWTAESSERMVALGLHPLQFIYQDNAAELDVLYHLNSKALQSGYLVGQFLLNVQKPQETMSDLNTDIFSP